MVTRQTLALSLLLVLACSSDPRPPTPTDTTVSSPQPKADPLAAPSDLLAPPADAVHSESGLVSRVLRAGSGDVSPRPFDRVSVYYTGWTTDGRMFASTSLRGAPATFRVSDMIPGWAEALMSMKVGERRRLWIPEKLAYLDSGPQGAVVIDVELLELAKGLAPLPAPSDLRTPPADALTTKSGLRHRLLEPATSDKRADSFDGVRIAFAGWNEKGEMFDSSQPQGEFAEVVASRGFPGWREALLLLSEGEKRRFWIPQTLAYERYPGAVPGDLVFDIKLLKVLDRRPPPPVPKDVARAPGSAIRTPSGLAYRVVEPGVGQRKPSLKSKVDLYYTCWTAGGKLVDSTVPSPIPQRASLSERELPPGVVEGLQHMVVGQTNRLWVPEKLGFYGQNKLAKGPLVFDVQLVAIYEGKLQVESM